MKSSPKNKTAHDSNERANGEGRIISPIDNDEINENDDHVSVHSTNVVSSKEPLLDDAGPPNTEIFFDCTKKQIRSICEDEWRKKLQILEDVQIAEIKVEPQESAESTPSASGMTTKERTSLRTRSHLNMNGVSPYPLRNGSSMKMTKQLEIRKRYRGNELRVK
jgi:hypothetical protein